MDDRRTDAVAAALLREKFDGHVTLEKIRERYGDEEFKTAQTQYRQQAREFLAMLDAAADFERNGDPDFKEIPNG